ncbi:phosphatidylserine decarboxylase family protein [Alphaproteobacteria bacterium]|jgi:phosphatidylserine decarboxylase|nr:phosphatidylserine decarboxylase family protein [Alphaproteobacteria bacterium]MDA8695094.1 phosphatidylserine decarboxylase family protein [Alphaproteobacteria bacterium]MDB2371360.1 phosphatidylserine decarboxylase family protein [Alphaproteobacteria bacterium]
MYFRFHKEVSAALIILFLLVVFFYFIYKPFFIILLILLIFTFYFFRDPERVVPLGDDILVSPADGLITNISETKEGKKTYTKVSIFLSIFNVHIQRLPISGTIAKVDYIEGKFINATLDKASDENERLKITIKNSNNLIYVTQIAGLIARRIINYVKSDQSVNQGERYGIIKFGSRVDIEFPNNFKLLVNEGQQCIGGETIIAQEIKSKVDQREFKKI